MPIPVRVRVKLSSEAAEFVSLTPVVVREMEMTELLEAVLGATGPDVARVREVLKRGSLVSGASRFRWQGMECDEQELEAALRAVPGPEPGRAFAVGKCVRVVLSGPGTRIEIAKEAAAQRRLLRKTSFWDVLTREAVGLEYAGYLYRERADRYVSAMDEEAGRRVREGAGLLRFTGLARQVLMGKIEKAEWVVGR